MEAVSQKRKKERKLPPVSLFRSAYTKKKKKMSASKVQVDWFTPWFFLSCTGAIRRTCENTKEKKETLDTFEHWRWRRISRLPWTAKKKLSIIRELSREFSFEEKATKVKIHCGHIVRAASSIEEKN